MRRLIALMLVLMLLCGCVYAPPAATTPSPMAGGENVGQNENLWLLPVEAAAAMAPAQLCAADDALLLCGREAGKLALALLSQEDLTLLAQTALEASDYAYVQTLADGFGVTDPKNGTVTLLGPDLEVLAVHQLDPDNASWLLRPDGGALVRFSSRDGVSLRELPTGEETPLLDPGYALQLYGLTGQQASFLRIGEDLRESWYHLDLPTGVLTPGGDRDAIIAGRDLQTLSDGRLLSRSGERLKLYDPDGSFVSSCTPDSSGENAAGYDFIWSDRWQGYFFLLRSGALMLWCPSARERGTNIALTLRALPAGEVLPRELYDRAAELSGRFCVDIRIADQCQLDYNTFHSVSYDDPEQVARALDTLELALSRYPEGYLDQLKYSAIRRIRIEVVGSLKPESDADVSKTAEAFSREGSTEYLVVLDGDALNETNIHHELSHIVDKRILLNTALRADAVFSEEAWMALQPEGFCYADSYTNISADVEEFYGSGYFARNYACVSASEDKATMMECAIMARTDIYEKNPHLLPKLEYYCACIRDSFDTEGWPEVTPWEQLLH